MTEKERHAFMIRAFRVAYDHVLLENQRLRRQIDLHDAVIEELRLIHNAPEFEQHEKWCLLCAVIGSWQSNKDEADNG